MSGMPSPFTSPNANCKRVDTRGEGLLGLEGAIAVAQQARSPSIIVNIGHDDVGFAVAG